MNDLSATPSMSATLSSTESLEHPRRIGWIQTTALALGGSNQSLFLIAALFAGQGEIPGQGSAAVLLLIAGVILGWAAAPGWIELSLMFPNRVGGIASSCAEAYRPYAPVLGNLTGVCYWWGWVPACGFCALLAASAIQHWWLPQFSETTLAVAIVASFTLINLCGVHWGSRLATVIALGSLSLAVTSAVVPVLSGIVDWQRAFTFDLTVPFEGHFGKITSAMAGLYLIGFAAPAFESATCHVGETINPVKNVPRAVFASAVLAGLFFVVIPVVWLGALGPEALGKELADVLGPTFAPLLGEAAKAASMWLMVLNLFHVSLQPIASASRTFAQLAEDGLLPRSFALRMKKTDVPWVATLVTSGSAIALILTGIPVWLLAAANFTYLTSICLTSIAVWLLRRDAPEMDRPYRAPRGTIGLGLIAAMCWAVSAIFGFQQFGLPTVIVGLVLAYSGSVLYAWRKYFDKREAGEKGVTGSLHIKLTGAMIAVLVLDGAGYLLAVGSVGEGHPELVTILEDIFVAVAILTVSVGLVLPGMIAHSAVEISTAAKRLAGGTLADFSRAMEALGKGKLEEAYARVDYLPVTVHSKDEVGEMADSFNAMQREIAAAAQGLEGAREGLRSARQELEDANTTLEQRVVDRTKELEDTHKRLVEVARKAGMAEVASGIIHNVGNVLNSVNVSLDVVAQRVKNTKAKGLKRVCELLAQHASDFPSFLANDEKGKMLPTFLEKLNEVIEAEHEDLLRELKRLEERVEHIQNIVSAHHSMAGGSLMVEKVNVVQLIKESLEMSADALGRHDVQIETQFHEVPELLADKHKIYQILMNLFQNAKQAMNDVNDRPKMMTVSLKQEDDNVIISVSDSGVGITSENLNKIFTHGFTTKKEGHGFGLHSSILAARELKGSLKASSEGLNKGATFILTLPVNEQKH